MNRSKIRNGIIVVVLLLAAVPASIGLNLINSRDSFSSLLPGAVVGTLLLAYTIFITANLLLFLWFLFRQSTASRFRMVLIVGPALLWFAGAAFLGDPWGPEDRLSYGLARLLFFYPIYLGLAWPFCYVGDALYGHDRKESRKRALVGVMAALPLILAIPFDHGPYMLGPLDVLGDALPFIGFENLAILLLLHIGLAEGETRVDLNRTDWLIVVGSILLSLAIVGVSRHDLWLPR